MNSEKKVYDVYDIQKMLGIGRNRVYAFLEEVYKSGQPFPVLKVGKLYKVPMIPFNKWINNEL